MRPLDHVGIVAIEGGRVVGHVSYRLTGNACEITSISATPPRRGVGSALMDALIARGRDEGWTRLWLTTTNDNLDALRFYQRRGFRLRGLRPGAVDAARAALKPTIPEVGSYEIPMRDELDLELLLRSS